MFEFLLGIGYVLLVSSLLFFLYIPPKGSSQDTAIVEEKIAPVVEAVYDPNAVILTGELYKLGSNETFKSWKLREFVLRGNVLQYYDLPRQPNDISKGDFDISDSYVRLSDAVECTNKAAMYSFIVYNNRNKIVLIAPSEGNRQKWIDTIKQQIRSYHRVLHRIRLRAATEAARANPGANAPSIASIEEFDTDLIPPIDIFKVSNLRNNDGSRGFGVLSNFRKGGAEREIFSWIESQNKLASLSELAAENLRPLSDTFPGSSVQSVAERSTRPQSTIVSSHKEANYAALTSRTDNERRQTKAAAAEAIRLATEARLTEQEEQAEFKRIAEEVNRKAEEEEAANRAEKEAQCRAEEARLSSMAEEVTLAEQARLLELEELKMYAQEAKDAQACVAEEAEISRKLEEVRVAEELRVIESAKLKEFTETARFAEAARLEVEEKVAAVSAAECPTEEMPLHNLGQKAHTAVDAHAAEETELARVENYARAAEEENQSTLVVLAERDEEVRAEKENSAQCSAAETDRAGTNVSATSQITEKRTPEAIRAAEAARALEEAKLKRAAAQARLKEASRVAEEAKQRRLAETVPAATEVERKRINGKGSRSIEESGIDDDTQQERPPLAISVQPPPLQGRRPSFLHSPDRAQDSDDEEDAVDSVAFGGVLCPAAAVAATASAPAADITDSGSSNMRTSIRSSFRAVDSEASAAISTSTPQSSRVQISNYNNEFDAVAEQFKAFFYPDGGEGPEQIVFTSLIGKKNPVGITYFRQLILTNAPRLFYVEPKSMSLKGEITWTVSSPPSVEAVSLMRLNWSRHLYCDLLSCFIVSFFRI